MTAQSAAPMFALLAGGVFYLIMLGGVLLGWVLALIALWRGMKAHESIAESLRQIAQKKEG